MPPPTSWSNRIAAVSSIPSGCCLKDNSPGTNTRDPNLDQIGRPRTSISRSDTSAPLRDPMPLCGAEPAFLTVLSGVVLFIGPLIE